MIWILITGAREIRDHKKAEALASGLLADAVAQYGVSTEERTT